MTILEVLRVSEDQETGQNKAALWFAIKRWWKCQCHVHNHKGAKKSAFSGSNVETTSLIWKSLLMGPIRRGWCLGCLCLLRGRICCGWVEDERCISAHRGCRFLKVSLLWNKHNNLSRAAKCSPFILFRTLKKMLPEAEWLRGRFSSCQHGQREGSIIL